MLACDFRAWPSGAPTVFDVLPAVGRVDRTANRLSVDCDPATAETVAGYVAAERLCRQGIRWDLDRVPRLRLRVSATPAQPDVLEQLFREQ